MPAKAGIQNHLKSQDSHLRGNGAKGVFSTFYETINFSFSNYVLFGLCAFVYLFGGRPFHIGSNPPDGSRIE